jgi:hypothetical protein
MMFTIKKAIAFTILIGSLTACGDSRHSFVMSDRSWEEAYVSAISDRSEVATPVAKPVRLRLH